jgi:hypothetical protein
MQGRQDLPLRWRSWLRLSLAKANNRQKPNTHPTPQQDDHSKVATFQVAFDSNNPCASWFRLGFAERGLVLEHADPAESVQKSQCNRSQGHNGYATAKPFEM